MNFYIGTKGTFAKKQTNKMHTVQLHLSRSFAHVAYLYLTRVISYKLRWNCQGLLERIDFLRIWLYSNILVGLDTSIQFTLPCLTKEALQYYRKPQARTVS